MDRITVLAILLDRSRSMYGRERQVLQVYRDLLARYRGIREPCLVTVGLFSDELELRCLGSDIAGIGPLTGRECFVRGATFLYDAVTETLQEVERILPLLRDDLEIRRRMYIITDGIDTGSPHHSREDYERILAQSKAKGWQIMLLHPDGTGTEEKEDGKPRETGNGYDPE